MGKYGRNTVAIKVYKKSKLNKDYKDFISESVIAVDLKHPNLVHIIGYCIKPMKCIVMSYVEGYNLHEYCYRDKMDNEWNSIDECIVIYLKVLNGLMFLHKNNIIHRDIAARNILINVKNGSITMNTEVRLSDFGCARRLSKNPNDSDIDIIQNDTYTQFGPIKWMSPEAIQFKKYSIPSDIYMFGMTMYEIFYRTEPYLSYTNIQVAVQLVLNKLKLQFPPKILINKKHLEITQSLKGLIELCTLNYYNDRMNTQSIHTNLSSMINNFHDRQPSKSDITSINSHNMSIINEDNDEVMLDNSLFL